MGSLLLPSITDYAHQAHLTAHYARLGPDWGVAVADVVGSTKLAEQGRDRDVNFVAGAVVAVLSVLARSDHQAAACQFAGDGAAAVVPPERIEACRIGLAALGHWAQQEMGISLRVGLVPVADLDRAGCQTWAALQDFGNDNVFGLFLGNGIATAESWVKGDARWRLEPIPGDLPGLEGLSCRWRPVPARRGHIYCFLIDPLQDGILADLNDCIESVIPTYLAAPLGNGDHLAPAVLPTAQSLRIEVKTVPFWHRLRRYGRALIGSAILGIVHRLGGRLGKLDTNQYRQAIAERSDYRRQSGGPRYVLDLTDAESAALIHLLDEFEAAGKLLYGVAQSDATTLTCMVGDFTADRHIHFVDGLGLGFWRASVPLKAKYKALKTPYSATQVSTP